MTDFVLGIFLAGLAVRGWLRGFVREALDLVGLVIGVWIAFVLGAPFGDFLTSSFGVTPEVARIGAGIALFLLFGVGLSIAAHYLTRLMSLPGLGLANHLGGAAVAAAWGIVIILVVVNIARVLPIPSSWEDGLEDSTVVSVIAGEDAFPQRMFSSLAGKGILTALAAIQDIFGANRAVPEGEETLRIPAAPATTLTVERDDSESIVEEMNRVRVGQGLAALQMSQALDDLAESRAVQMYVSGELKRDTDCRAEAIASSDVTVLACTDLVGLASTSMAALDAILQSETGSTEIARSLYDRTGVGVVSGPTGHLVVIVLAA